MTAIYSVWPKQELCHFWGELKYSFSYHRIYSTFVAPSGVLIQLTV